MKAPTQWICSHMFTHTHREYHEFIHGHVTSHIEQHLILSELERLLSEMLHDGCLANLLAILCGSMVVISSHTIPGDTRDLPGQLGVSFVSFWVRYDNDDGSVGSVSQGCVV